MRGEGSPHRVPRDVDLDVRGVVLALQPAHHRLADRVVQLLPYRLAVMAAARFRTRPRACVTTHIMVECGQHGFKGLFVYVLLTVPSSSVSVLKYT